jgi:hypothetical protein
MVNNCDLSAWSSNSECAHATGPTALGPFVHKDVIVPVSVFCVLLASFTQQCY